MFGWLLGKKDDAAQPAQDMSAGNEMSNDMGGDNMSSNPVSEPMQAPVESATEEAAEAPAETMESEEMAEDGEEGADDEEPASSSSMISFDDFTKVEMSVGEVVSAEKVEGADRLLKLEVNFGTEARQIVSGIAEYFKPEDLIGKKYSFVTNLEPRTIRSVESNGMIMAAKDEDNNFSLMSVDSSVKAGTKLS